MNKKPMKKRQLRNKLALNRETLRTLDSGDLGKIYGGNDDVQTHPGGTGAVGCPSCKPQSGCYCCGPPKL